jgi:general nucleoside transport system permease protein
MNLNRSPFLIEFLRIVAVAVIALSLGFVITAMVSEEPVQAYGQLLTGPLPRISWVDGSFTLRGLNRFGNWIEDSITLILVGLAVAIVFRARQFSLGAEGQIYLGALAAGIISLHVAAPRTIHIGLALIAAAAVGFIWGLIPGILKAYVKADEIVSTLMLNVIAIQFYNLLLTRWLKDPTAGYLSTEFFPDTAVLPLVIPGTRVTIALFMVIVAIIAVWFLMERTPLGYEIKMIGANLEFARYGGINTKRVIALSMAVSGILAGLAGAELAMGIQKRLVLNLSTGIGFEGIVVALLARNNPKGVLLAGLFYGYLRIGAEIMERSSDVTREVVLIVQAVIILLITAERILPLLQAWRRRRQSVDEEIISAEPREAADVA